MKQITPFHTNHKPQLPTKKNQEMPYEPKNILITGGAGFIASHAAILFAKKYPHCKVRCVNSSPSIDLSRAKCKKRALFIFIF